MFANCYVFFNPAELKIFEIKIRQQCTRLRHRPVVGRCCPKVAADRCGCLLGKEPKMKSKNFNIKAILKSAPMRSEFFTFKSNYLKRSYYVLGNYSLLKSNLFDHLLRVYFTDAADACPVCDILVVNITNVADFRLSVCLTRYKCVIYTLRPFESIARYFNYMIKYRCVIFDIDDRFIIVSLEYNIGNKPNMAPSSLSAYNGTRLSYMKKIELCVNKFLGSYVRTERDLAEEDTDEALRNAVLKSTYNQKIQFHRLGGIVTYAYSRAGLKAGNWKAAASGRGGGPPINLPRNFQFPRCRLYFRGEDPLRSRPSVPDSSWHCDYQNGVVMDGPRHCFANMLSLFEDEDSSEASEDSGGFSDTQRKVRYVQHRLEDGLCSDTDLVTLASARSARRSGLSPVKRPCVASSLDEGGSKRYRYDCPENGPQSDPFGSST